MTETTALAETNHFIVLDEYTPIEQPAHYQSEADLEREFIADLVQQGYEYRQDLNTPAKLLANVRDKLQSLNGVVFSDTEWARFVAEYLDKQSEAQIGKTRKIHDDYVYDFAFDNGVVKNIYLLDKHDIGRNHVQLINQFAQTGKHANRYDVTVLVNGLPLVHIELKKRGIAIREAFNQVHRYGRESFNAEHSLFQYVQIFVISNGTDTRYFANTTKRDKNSFDFTMNWAKSDNSPIKDLKDFTATFFQKNTLLSVLLKYSVFDVNDNLLIMRPYQIAAAERILWRINIAEQSKRWGSGDAGGFVWHTTGSGKTLTSFKAARLATQLSFVDKVFFVVDRKDLDYQTMKEYQRFSPDSVNGSHSTAGLKRNLDKDDNKIIVTTIQKLNNLMKGEVSLPVYQQNVVFIFDECHRSQFGEAQKNLKRKFKRFCQFGFTGTPIFPENALGAETTAGVFGSELHAYVITDAIRDEKVLKFKVDYNDVRPKFKEMECERDDGKLSALESRLALLHPERIREITQYVLKHFHQKTHRLYGNRGFNALFAVSSVEAAKLYYECFRQLQSGCDKPLRVATIFSYAANEAHDAAGDIADEGFEPSALDCTAKDFLQTAIDDYNAYFGTNYRVDGEQFQNYYRDLAKRVREQEVDLLIVVGMFLTGFDAPKLNTLFVDKNLRYHGLIQAYSRTNRIFDATKTFGNIVTFRDLEQATIDAIRLFGNAKTKNVILEKSYGEYMQGHTDVLTGEVKRGYREVAAELLARFPKPDHIETEQDKRDFTKLFGEYLRLENVLRNYDEFAALQVLQVLDTDDAGAVAAFKAAHYLDDECFDEMRRVAMPSERALQDYRSAYHDIREWLRRQQHGRDNPETLLDWDDIVFEVDLLKSQEINLDYILALIFEKNRQTKDKNALIEDIRRTIRASIGNRAKESLVVDFIRTTDLDTLDSTANVIEAFFMFAQKVQRYEAAALIADAQLNEAAAKRYLTASLKREYASENGTELTELLPKINKLNPQYLTLKQSVFQKISAFVEKFKGVGGTI
ncbi:type I restriction endonuclease subunit R [Conchiformibius kuhniae]|uniref:Type I restriction enzyme endonuclease subunit n=1 Tax=Conchiformibius kuhniae TaxID=211502 RepID=A0A8T9MR43_9NEIS|nr:type I restriction endonuclease subunit R [Conchiformibius kuhniae]UOP04360.1 type I restriction endonuclease subunit R [Conchiformibius kuhniae]